MIPQQLREYPLIKVCHPDCRVASHGDCGSPGKRPVRSVDDDRPITEIRRWLEQGGNYGVVARGDNDLVILDSDSVEFGALVEEELPATFTVRTGSGNRHFYFRSGYPANQSYKTDTGEFGSIRAQNYQAVGPNSVHPETGREYIVCRDEQITPVPKPVLIDFAELVAENSREAGGGSGGGGAASRRNTTEKAEDLRVEPTTETARSLGFINSESRRRQVAKVIDHRHPSRRVRAWAAGFLYSVCGLTQNQIERLLRARADWATDDDEITRQVRNMIHKTVESRRASESVDLDRYLNLPDDSGERGAPDEGKPRHRTMSQEATYNTRESVIVVESGGDPQEAEDGERLVKATRTEAEDGGDEFEFAQILAGKVERDDAFGVSPNWQANEKGQDKTRTIGSADPEYLRTVAQALEELADGIEQ